MRSYFSQLVFLALLAALALATAGCSTLRVTGENDDLAGLLEPVSVSPKSVTLELVFMRVPARDEQLHEDLWHGVDEQNLPLELRRALANNGIRSGVIGTQLPTALSQLLQGEPGEEESPLKPTEAWQENRRMQVLPGQRGEIVASDIYPQLCPLFSDEGHICGHSRQQAQCIFAFETFPQPDGRVLLQLVPEVHHGQAKQRFVSGGGGGAYRLETGRDRESYDSLRLECHLAPGESLLLSATHNGAGLGRCFFTNEESDERRLLLIRLARAQGGDLYTPLTMPDVGVEE